MKTRCTAIIVLLALLVTTISMPVFCNTPISVIFNGEKLIFDVEPMIMDGRTLVPMRVVFEAFGAVVTYDQQTQRITATKTTEADGTREIVMMIGSVNARITINGIIEEVMLDTAPVETEGRTLVPVRFISEALGADVSWDGIKQQVMIYTSDRIWNDAIDPWQDLEAYQAVYVVNEYLALLQGAVWGGALYEYHLMLFTERVREAPEPWALIWQPSMAGMVGTSVCRLNFRILEGRLAGKDEFGKKIYEIAARVRSYDPRAGEPVFTDWIKAYTVIYEEYVTESGSTAAHWVIDSERVIEEARLRSEEMPDFWQ